MSTINQVVKNKRYRPSKRTLGSFLCGGPQRKGICLKVYTTKPKKPHSAIRKVAKVFMPAVKKNVLASIPGQGHNLSVHSVVLIRGGRVRDLPGIHAKLIRNKYDFVAAEPFVRHRRRSKYGYPFEG